MGRIELESLQVSDFSNLFDWRIDACSSWTETLLGNLGSYSCYSDLFTGLNQHNYSDLSLARVGLRRRHRCGELEY